MLRRIHVFFFALIAMLAISACGGAAQVDMSDIQTYKSTSGVYSINIPKAWKIADQSTPGSQQAMWTDANDNALIFVSVAAIGTTDPLPIDKLGVVLQDSLKTQFGTQPAFKISEPAPQADGSVRVSWSYDATVGTSDKIPLSGSSYIEQRGDKLGILMTALPTAQMDALKDAQNQVVSSFKINETAPVP